MDLDVIEAEDRVAVSAAVPARNAVRAERPQPSVRETAESRIVRQPRLLWRFLSVVVGAALAVTGWALVMTAILSFIGLPLFIFGLALMQSAER